MFFTNLYSSDFYSADFYFTFYSAFLFLIFIPHFCSASHLCVILAQLDIGLIPKY